MIRWGLRLLLVAVMLGAVVASAAALRMGPVLEARRESDRLVDRAQEAAAAGDRWESRRLVEEALEIDGKNGRARRELAMHLVAEGQTDQALAELLRAAETKSNDAGAARELAAAFWATGNEKESVRWLKEAVRRDPIGGVARVDLARCLLDTRDTAGALKVAEENVLFYPHWQLAWGTLGLARLKSDDRAGALEALDEALRLRPHDVLALIAAAGVANDLGRKEDALSYARRAVSADEQSAPAWFTLGQLLGEQGREAEAREALTRARSLSAPLPESPVRTQPGP